MSERIDWVETIQARNERNPDDTTLFVTQSRYENYDLAENIVLKRAADILERGFRLWASELLQYDWGSGWTDDMLQRTRARHSSGIVTSTGFAIRRRTSRRAGCSPPHCKHASRCIATLPRS